MKITTNALRELSAVTSTLTVIAAIPYEKDIMGLVPPAWAPKILVASAIATVLLRLLPRILRLFGIELPTVATVVKPPNEKP